MNEDRVVESSVFECLHSCKAQLETVESSKCLAQLQFYHTRVAFSLPEHLTCTTSPVRCDDDGDLLVERKMKQCCIFIEQCSSTPLELVGLQIWGAALLLCDYLLHNSHLVMGKLVLELGAGVGLCSMVASIFAKKVMCTDVGNTVLKICQKNVCQFLENYESLLMDAKSQKSAILVRELDWTRDDPLIQKSEYMFRLSDEEKQMLQETTVYLASDVIYDDNLTDAFFKTIIPMMEKASPSVLILSLEKRLNFVVDTLDVRSPHYDYFIKSLQNLTQRNHGGTFWQFESMPTDFPQYFHYPRTDYLELWKIECMNKDAAEM